MKRTVGRGMLVLGGILLIVGGILFWQHKKVEAPALRGGEEVLVSPKEETLEETKIPDEASPSVEVEAVPVTTPSTSGVNAQTKASVSTTDCENECQNYTEAEALRYCRSLCGLELPSYQDKDCASVAVNERDFCFKEEAIRKQDTEMCAKIKDVKLRKTCEARIAEDLF